MNTAIAAEADADQKSSLVMPGSEARWQARARKEQHMTLFISECPLK